MKHNHFIAIFDGDNKIKYVTSIDNKTRTARWDDFKPAVKLPQSVADDICFALNVNGHRSVVIRATANMMFFNGKCDI